MAAAPDAGRGNGWSGARILWFSAGAGLLTFIVLVVLWAPLVAGYFPSNDELAIEASSTPMGGAVHPAQWFTRGFHGLFEPYPEWGSPNTDYFRPAAQALFWFHYAVFGTAWGSQLVLGYLAHALVVALVAHLALGLFRLRPLPALLATLACALNPGFWGSEPMSRFPVSYVVQFPIFQTEIVCGLLMLVAFAAFAYGRFALFSFVAIAALCLKENALTLPVTALVLVGAWRAPTKGASLRRLAWILLPLGLWFFCKLVVFDHGLSPPAAVAHAPAASVLAQAARDALFWPSSAFQGSLRDTVAAARSGDTLVLAQHGLALAFNLAWWVAILGAAAYAARGSGRRWLLERPEPWVAALVFALGNLALFLAMQDTQLRHGYFWFALGPLALLGLLSRLRWGTAAGAVLALGLALPQLPGIARQQTAEALDRSLLVKQAARQLVDTLSHLPADVRTVYIVDDIVVQPAGPENLAKLAGFSGRVVLVNSLDLVAGCHAAAADPSSRLRLVRDAGGTTLDYGAPPDCFRWAWMIAPVEQLARGPALDRGPWMRYEFPELQARAGSLVMNKVDYDVGRHWRLRVADPQCAVASHCRWYALDPAGRRYEEIAATAP